jgi:AAA domain
MTEPFEYEPPEPEAEPGTARPVAAARGTSYADILPMDPDWLWAGRIAFGEVTVVAAKGGTGKTFAMCDLAARVTRGDVLPGGTPAGPPGRVMIVNAEDDPSTVLAHRLIAARADLSRVVDFSEPDGAAFILGGPGDCVPMLHEAVTAAGDVRLVVLDPLAGISAYGLTSVVRVQAIMRSLRRMARDTGAAVVVIHHLTKKGDIAGSKAVVDAVRSVLLVDRTEDGTRVVTVHKGNNVSDQAQPVRYRITGEGTAAEIEWLGEDSGEGREGGPAQRRVLTALALADRPLTGQQLASRTALPYGSVRVILFKLKQRGVAENVSRGLWTAIRADADALAEQVQVRDLKLVTPAGLITS